jgi:hypothetical protein
LNQLLRYETATELAAGAKKTGNGIGGTRMREEVPPEEQMGNVPDPQTLTGVGTYSVVS